MSGGQAPPPFVDGADGPTPGAASPGARAKARCDILGERPYSDTPKGLYRGFLTPAHRMALQAVGEWMAAAGMAVRLDPAGNLVGRYEGEQAGAPALMIGSHIDSVRDAGRYDGVLGVTVGIECVDALHAAGRRLPFAIEVVAFGDEEGSRFPASMLCSRALAGSLDPKALEIVDAEGVPLADALTDFGLHIDRVVEAARPAASLMGYVEVHIEQGPVLEAAGSAVGVVTAIAGQRRLHVALSGRAGHAGTTPMTLRQDALTAAAECVLAVESTARSAGGSLVATVGALTVAPGAPNVIPGAVTFPMDVRAPDDGRRDAACDALVETFRTVAERRGVGVETAPVQKLAASACDAALTDRLADAIAAEGVAPLRLVSGAGHDAMVMAGLCPTTMLFVRSPGGVSHNPEEAVDAADVDIALRVMGRFIDSLAAAHAG